MKRAVAFSFLLACCGVLLGDSTNPGSSPTRKPATLLEDLVAMTRAGSSDVAVLAYAKAHRADLPPEVSDSDLRWLRNSGVSESVVAYMTAIDVRASSEGAWEDVASSSDEETVRPRAAYSNSQSDYDIGSSYPDRYAESSYDAYPGYGYDDYGYYPFYDYGYYPYPTYFFIDRDGFFRRFRGRDHRFVGRGGFDRNRGFQGRGRTAVGRGGSREAWRERGFAGRRDRSVVVGPRASGRSGFGRGGFPAGAQGSRGRAFGQRGFGPSGPARGSFPHGFSGPRGGGGGHGGFSHPGFSGSPRAASGFSRGASGNSGGGGRAAGGPHGGRGRP